MHLCEVGCVKGPSLMVQVELSDKILLQQVRQLFTVVLSDGRSIIFIYFFASSFNTTKLIDP